MKKTAALGGRLGYPRLGKSGEKIWVVTWGPKFSTEWNPWFLYEKFHETLTVASHASNMFDEWWTFFLFDLLTIGEACTLNSPKKENVKIHQILLMMTLTLRKKTYLLYTLLQSSLFPPKALLFPFWDMCSFPGIYIHALAPFSLLKTNTSPENWCLEHGFFIRKKNTHLICRFIKFNMWVFPKIGGFYPQNGWWK